jgi:hypothetical protein
MILTFNHFDVLVAARRELADTAGPCWVYLHNQTQKKLENYFDFFKKLFVFKFFIRWVACPANALSRPGFLSVGEFL